MAALLSVFVTCCDPLLVWGSSERALRLPDVAGCCYALPSVIARFLIQSPARSSETFPTISMVSEQPLHAQNMPFAKGWALLCLALLQKIFAFLSCMEYSFKNRNFQIFYVYVIQQFERHMLLDERLHLPG